MSPSWQRRRRKSLMKRDRQCFFKAIPLVIIIILFGCDAIPKRHFESAEKMWTDGDYKGAL